MYNRFFSYSIREQKGTDFTFLEYFVHTRYYHLTKIMGVLVNIRTEVPWIRERMYSKCDITYNYYAMNSSVRTVKWPIGSILHLMKSQKWVAIS